MEKAKIIEALEHHIKHLENCIKDAEEEIQSLNLKKKGYFESIKVFTEQLETLNKEIEL